jgi:hypothetical protein
VAKVSVQKRNATGGFELEADVRVNELLTSPMRTNLTLGYLLK